MMMFDLFASKSYPLSNDNYKRRTSSELFSLISETLPIDSQGQCCSIAIPHHEDPNDSPSEQNEHSNLQVCRICYSTGDLQSLIAPCQCSGTMGRLHQTCLERWLEISNTSKCEICQQEYEIVRYPKSLFYFLTNPLRPSDIRYLINDLMLFVFLSIIICWLGVLSVGKIRFVKTFYDATSLIFLPLSVFIIYLVWCWVSFRYHLQVMKEWRSVNQLIRVNVRKSNLQTEDDLLPEICVIK